MDRTIGIVDASGAVVACTDLPRIGEMREEAITELGFAGEIVRFGGYTYHITGERSTRLEYAVFVQGEDELARSICSLVAVSINNIKTLYDEKHDKATFVKNIIWIISSRAISTSNPASCISATTCRALYSGAAAVPCGCGGDRCRIRHVPG